MQTRSQQHSADTNVKPASFWSSKLGHASLASIAAMSAVVVLSSQVNADPLSASAGSALFEQHADTPALIEIA